MFARFNNVAMFCMIFCALCSVSTGVLLYQIGVFRIDPGESVAKLPPAGSLLGLITAYHFVSEKYSLSPWDFTQMYVARKHNALL